MKSYDRFSEDIEQRRVALAQRQKETLARSKEKGAQVSSDASASFAAQKAVSYTHLTLPTTPYV